MIEAYPNLLFFNRLYWHQMAPEVYGSPEEAFRQYLEDASKLVDGGDSIKRDLYKEFTIIAATDHYEKWVAENLCNEQVIKRVGGNILSAETIASLKKILESTWRRKDA